MQAREGWHGARAYAIVVGYIGRRPSRRRRTRSVAVTIRRYSGPTVTNIPAEYRVWLSEEPSADFRRRFLELADTSAARPLRLTLEKNAATFTFVSSGDLKTELQMIDLLLKQASQ